MSSSIPKLDFISFSQFLRDLLKISDDNNNDELSCSIDFLLCLTQISLTAQTVNNDLPLQINEMSDLVSNL